MPKNRSKRETDSKRIRGILVFIVLFALALAFRVAVAHFLANDAPDDGRVYAQMARNILEQHVYSHDTAAPFGPSLIRLPGYPLFLAGVYKVFGHTNNTAVRLFQAVIDTATCGLIALLAFHWEPDEKRKRRTAVAALALAAVCPFTVIYVGTILTEVPTMFFAVAMCLTATLAVKSVATTKAILLWCLTGILAACAVMFRPDSGLFALAIGLTLVVATLGRPAGVKLTGKRAELLYRTARTSYLGAVFSLAFCLVLVPWTVRNYRLFHVFQPLAPAHAEMPGEFVPRGYLTWVRSWIDDPRYVGTALWNMDSTQLKVSDFPERAFDSAEEKQKVAALFEQYNHPPDEESGLFTEPTPSASPSPESQNQAENNQNDNDNSEEADNDNDNSEEADNDNDNSNDEDEGQEEPEANTNEPQQDQSVEMTPQVDAGFAQIARDRIARHPFRYYVLLPLKRAHALWFNTHSEYYPFEGDLLPLDDLDYDIHQQYWLPLFAALTLIYTLLGVGGGWVLWHTRRFIPRLWLLLAALMIFLRLGFFATLENPEPRYVVEIFPFLIVFGGMASDRLLDLIAMRRMK